ncbi:hypothetical protein [Bradyrhizobium sp. SZCCHNRI1073]|uniref:hypothetical protein n=2 Tax=Bradyrhizobium TaxID=374 RepID=UPI00291648C0|nr:hypothetical protein [Bradyrhizobium sp. SZCCHNRI1073]
MCGTAGIELISLRMLVGLALIVTLLFVAAGAATSLLVAHGAEEIAGSEPYCIQISDGASDYRPARVWFDLSIFKMRARHDGLLYMQHHAILVVGEPSNVRLYHWSYLHRVFEPGVINGQIEGRGPAITCLQVRDFVGKRLALIPVSPDSYYIRYSGGETYLIPTVWQAEWSGGSSPSLLLATTAPDFQPLDRRLMPAEFDSNSVFVTWDPEWMLSLMKDPPGGEIVEQSREFGLVKTKTITHGKDGKEYVGNGYLAYDDGHGVNTTIIGCGTPSEAVPKSCQHRFINKGRHFYFRHRPEDVPNWQRMQQRILDLMASFEVHRRS